MTEKISEPVTAVDARRRLEAGNARYVNGRGTHPRADPNRRAELVGGQHPFATILTCADSRVSPELVFDEGLGDLFVVRVAGNIASDAVLGSIEYASANLGVRLVVVMGHQSCGAVGAAVQHVGTKGRPTETHVDTLIDAIRPAVQSAKASSTDDLLDRSIRANALQVADQIRRSEPVMANLLPEGVEIAAAYYELTSGIVSFLG